MIFVLEDDPNRIRWFRQNWPGMVHTDNPVIGLDMVRDRPDLEMIFLDHDLGGAPYTRGDCGDGIDFAVALAHEGLHADTPITIHSLNVVGAKNITSDLLSGDMKAFIRKYSNTGSKLWTRDVAQGAATGVAVAINNELVVSGVATTGLSQLEDPYLDALNRPLTKVFVARFAGE